MRCLLIALVMIASPAMAVNKCKVGGKTVYTDLTCEAVGGAGGVMTGGNVSSADPHGSKKELRLIDDQLVEVTVMPDYKAINTPAKEPDRRPAVVTAENTRSRNFQRCSDLEKQRIDAVRNGQREYADQINDYMKQTKCM